MFAGLHSFLSISLFVLGVVSGHISVQNMEAGDVPLLRKLVESRIGIELADSGDIHTDYAAVSFVAAPAPENDRDLNILKPVKVSSFPQLTIPKSGISYGLMTSVPKAGRTVVPLNITSGKAGTYTLYFSDVNSFGEYTNIYLEDRKELKMVNLMQHSSYFFDLNGVSGKPDRFRLIFFRTSPPKSERGLLEEPISVRWKDASQQSCIIKDDIGNPLSAFLTDASGKMIKATSAPYSEQSTQCEISLADVVPGAYRLTVCASGIRKILMIDKKN